MDNRNLKDFTPEILDQWIREGYKYVATRRVHPTYVGAPKWLMEAFVMVKPLMRLPIRKRKPTFSKVITRSIETISSEYIREYANGIVMFNCYVKEK